MRTDLPAIGESTVELVLDTLLTTGDAGTEVSMSALRAVHEAFGIESFKVVAIAAAHDADFDGDRLIVRRELDHTCERHRSVLIALRAGADSLEDVLAELARHALRCEADASSFIDPALDAARAASPNVALDVLDRELVSTRGVIASARGFFERRAAMLALDLGRSDAVDRLLAVRDDLDGSLARRRAALAYHASRSAPAVLSEQLMAEIEATPPVDAPGWAARARALRLMNEGDVEQALLASREAVAAAVAAGDRDLESHALVALANARAWNGDLHGAIRMQRRALRIAIGAGGWRAAAVGAANLAWMLVEDLQLDAARTIVDELIELVDERGLAVHVEEALLHGARVALFAGDMERARRLTDRHAEVVSASDTVPVDSFDASYRANRIAEIAVALDSPNALDLARHARALHERVGIEEQELEVTLIEASISDELMRTTAQAIVPSLLSDGEAYMEALALTWLARRVTLDACEDARASLDVAIGAVKSGRGALLDLALDEAAAARSDARGRWRRLADVARRWRDHGFAVDAALCEAAAGVAAAEVGDGAEAARLLDSAHRALSEIGAANHTMRVREARARVQQHTDARSARSFLDEVSADESRELFALAIRRVVPLGERFPEDHICSIVSGVARVESIDAGGLGTSLFDVVGAGWTTGIAAVVEPDAKRRFITVAHTPCVVEAIPIDALISRAGRSHRFALAIARTLASQYERIAAVLHRRSDPILDRRIAATVFDAANELGVPGPDGVLELRLTRQVLGDLAGTTRESVSRAIARFSAEGILELRGHRIVVRDLDALRATAEDTP